MVKLPGNQGRENEAKWTIALYLSDKEHKNDTDGHTLVSKEAIKQVHQQSGKIY